MSDEQQKNKYEKFVDFVIQKSNSDSGYRAAMKRADNPNTESMAWQYLVRFCDIEKDWERMPYCLVGAAIARNLPSRDGNLKLGEAFSSICKDKDAKEREGKRLLRIIACDEIEEEVRALRPVLAYIASQGVSVCYSKLLEDLCRYDRQRVHLRWVEQFYGDYNKEEEKE